MKLVRVRSTLTHNYTSYDLTIFHMHAHAHIININIFMHMNESADVRVKHVLTWNQNVLFYLILPLNRLFFMTDLTGHWLISTYVQIQLPNSSECYMLLIKQSSAILPAVNTITKNSDL